MKKLSYRDKLIELAYIYDVKEIKDYVKSRKSLTSGQLELILKNKIVIPKDLSLILEITLLNLLQNSTGFAEFKDDKIKIKTEQLEN